MTVAEHLFAIVAMPIGVFAGFAASNLLWHRRRRRQSAVVLEIIATARELIVDGASEQSRLADELETARNDVSRLRLQNAVLRGWCGAPPELMLDRKGGL